MFSHYVTGSNAQPLMFIVLLLIVTGQVNTLLLLLYHLVGLLLLGG